MAAEERKLNMVKLLLDKGLILMRLVSSIRLIRDSRRIWEVRCTGLWKGAVKEL